MKTLVPIFILLACTVLNPAFAQEQQPVASESRDASLAYIGTSNFIVATISNRCKGSIRNGKSSREFVLEWQERNARYIVAAAFYMERRLAEALANGGPEERNAIYQEVTSVSRENGKAAIQRFFNTEEKDESCNQALGLIGDGTFDITPRVEIYQELKELAQWAEQQ